MSVPMLAWNLLVVGHFGAKQEILMSDFSAGVVLVIAFFFPLYIYTHSKQ